MTDYKSMFEQAVRTLAAIDEALGIGDDGCGDPDQTLTAIEELKAAKGNRLVNGVVDTPQEQEHVATVQCINGVTIGYLEKMLPVGTKLYTAQPAQQPLTQPEKQRLWNDAMHNNRSSTTDAAMEYGRAIELAHGIGGEKP